LWYASGKSSFAFLAIIKDPCVCIRKEDYVWVVDFDELQEID
jgi:hypothetical protein